jgi:hypothetical protein
MGVAIEFIKLLLLFHLPWFVFLCVYMFESTFACAYFIIVFVLLLKHVNKYIIGLN